MKPIGSVSAASLVFNGDKVKVTDVFLPCCLLSPGPAEVLPGICNSSFHQLHSSATDSGCGSGCGASSGTVQQLALLLLSPFNESAQCPGKNNSQFLQDIVVAKTFVSMCVWS